jgi:hypothetical protein
MLSTPRAERPVADVKASAAGRDSVAEREVTRDAGGYEITLGPADDIAGKVLMRGHSLCVGMGETVRHDVEPDVELILCTCPYLHSGRSR